MIFGPELSGPSSPAARPERAAHGTPDLLPGAVDARALRFLLLAPGLRAGPPVWVPTNARDDRVPPGGEEPCAARGF